MEEGYISMNKPYHHGNLKNELLEAGIDLINKEGENNFSLRKVAALCGVSHAAPYSHFQNKEDLLREMQAYVTAQFMEVLEETVRTDSTTTRSSSYGSEKPTSCFSSHHPSIFHFCFSQPCMEIDSLNNGRRRRKRLSPFRFFATWLSAS
jgi:AcrR family transcriptional regulator